jgi:hypothetical protein
MMKRQEYEKGRERREEIIREFARSSKLKGVIRGHIQYNKSIHTKTTTITTTTTI